MFLLRLWKLVAALSFWSINNKEKRFSRQHIENAIAMTSRERTIEIRPPSEQYEEIDNHIMLACDKKDERQLKRLKYESEKRKLTWEEEQARKKRENQLFYRKKKTQTYAKRWRKRKYLTKRFVL